MTYEEYKVEFYEKLMKFHNSDVGNDKIESPETRVIFLDGDYGWGKTRLIKNIKNEQKENISMEIYSPWLSVNDKNIIVDLWSFLKKFDIRKSYRVFYLLSLIATITLIVATIFASTVAPLLNANSVLLLYVSITLLLIVSVKKVTKDNEILKFVSYKENADEKFYGYYIEDIVDKMPQILFVEDIDRLDQAELLILLKMIRSISDVLNEKKIKKTIVLTGSALRVINKCDGVGGEPKPGIFINEDSNGNKFNTFRRVVSLVIKFYSVENHISELLKEANINIGESMLISTVILNLIQYYDITVRDFVHFLRGATNLSTRNIILEFISWYFSEKVVGDYKKRNINIGLGLEKTFLFTTESQMKFSYIPLLEVELMLQLVEGFQNITFDTKKFIKSYHEMIKIPMLKHSDNTNFNEYLNSKYADNQLKKNAIQNFFVNNNVFPDEFNGIFEGDSSKINYEMVLQNEFLKSEIYKSDYNSSKEFLIAKVFYLEDKDLMKRLFPKLYETLKKGESNARKNNHFN